MNSSNISSICFNIALLENYYTNYNRIKNDETSRNMILRQSIKAFHNLLELELNTKEFSLLTKKLKSSNGGKMLTIALENI